MSVDNGKRDLHKDLGLFESGIYPSGLEVIEIGKHALKRAIKAETLNRELVELLGKVFSALEWFEIEQGTYASDTLEECKERFAKAKEVMGDEN